MVQCATVKELGLGGLSLKSVGFTPKYFTIDRFRFCTVFSDKTLHYEIGFYEIADIPGIVADYLRDNNTTSGLFRITDPENFEGYAKSG